MNKDKIYKLSPAIMANWILVVTAVLIVLAPFLNEHQGYTHTAIEGEERDTRTTGMSFWGESLIPSLESIKGPLESEILSSNPFEIDDTKVENQGTGGKEESESLASDSLGTEKQKDLLWTSLEKAGQPYREYIIQASRRYDVDCFLVMAIIKAESSYNPQAVSRKGARGLMQLMPKTARALGVDDSFDPEKNINGGVKYFKILLDRFKGDVTLALAAYNAGSRKVRHYRGIPPFKATQSYIDKVLLYYHEYKKQLLKGSDTA
ncbi:MAG: lytic transglycosylase domain-containing protein [Thermodesulfobacteriota bacterium]|jgi:soluble lytic murein transglycosylase-like protein|nr:lytic transglycosylase domain-containing protein [Thermodesulfobacteriota bacterium]